MSDAALGLEGLSGSQGTRFGEFSKLLPVGCVLVTVLVIYTEYVFLHCLRLLQFDLPEEVRKADDVSRGWSEMTAFHVITGLFLYCLAKCILTYPGTIPDGKSADGRSWDLRPDMEDQTAGDEERGPGLLEKKHTGERRHCKWCLKYKPDRCHHCRICNICVLRMDHHCPWVYNCIGFRNHKYFFLLLVYAALDLIVVNLTMFESVWWSTRMDVSIFTMIALTFGETLATFLMVLICSFLAFHVWLMTKAMTTVEFCEKSLKKASYNSSAYSQGLYANICAVLGNRPLLWLLPFSLPDGDGLTWPQNNNTAISGSDSQGGRDSSGSAPVFTGGEERSGPASAAAGGDEGSGRASGRSRRAAGRSQPAG